MAGIDEKQLIGILLILAAAGGVYWFLTSQNQQGVACLGATKWSAPRQQCVDFNTFCADSNQGGGWIYDAGSQNCIQVTGCSPAGGHCGLQDSSGHCCLSGLSCYDQLGLIESAPITGVCRVACNVGASCTTSLGSAGSFQRAGDSACYCVANGITNPSAMPPCAATGQGCGNFNGGMQCCVGRCDYALGYPPLQCFNP